MLPFFRAHVRLIAITVATLVVAPAAYPLTQAALDAAHAEFSNPAPALVGPMAVLITGYLTASRRWTAVGFRRPTPSRSLHLSAGVIAAVLAVTVADVGGFAPRTAASVAGVLLFTALVAFVEETAFRGFIARILQRRRGTGFAVLVSSLVFGAAHGLNAAAGQSAFETVQQVVFAAAFGVFAATVYFGTGSLALPIALHWSYDATELLGRHQTSGLVPWLNILILLLGAALVGRTLDHPANRRLERLAVARIRPERMPAAGA